jgi:hypothetical protein
MQHGKIYLRKFVCAARVGRPLLDGATRRGDKAGRSGAGKPGGGKQKIKNAFIVLWLSGPAAQ